LNHVAARVVPPVRLAGVLSLVLCLAAAGQAAALTADLEWVPADSAAFIRVLPREIWDSQIFEEQRDLLRLAQPEAVQAIERTTGIYLPDLERLTIVFPSLDALTKPFPDGTPQGVSALLVVRLDRPCDRNRLLERLAPGGRVKSWRGRNYHFHEERWAGLFLVDERTFVYGSEDSLIWLFEKRDGKVGKGPLSDALRLAEGKTHVVAACQLSSLPRDILKRLPPAAAPLQPLLDAQAELLAIDLSQGLRLEWRVYFADRDRADQGERAVKVALEMARQGLVLAEQKVQEQLAATAQPLEAAGMSYLLALVRFGQSHLKSVQVQRQDLVVQASLQAEKLIGTTPMLLLASVAAINTLGQNANNTFERVQGGFEAVQPEREKDPELKELYAAMTRYHEDRGHYPPPAIYGKDGQPLLSWRVALLPYLGQEKLYGEFKLDEPWDSVHNKKLLDRMPGVFRTQLAWDTPSWKSTRQVFTGPGTLFDSPRARRRADISDDPGQTILLVQTAGAAAVPWSKPADRAYEPGKPLPVILGPSEAGFSVVMADGTIRFVQREMVEKVLPGLITRSGSERE
jgi:hypothetical protein